MSNNWKKLQMETDFYDVTLACDDNQVQAHKVVLSSCSPVLKKLLRQNHHPHPVFYLRGVKFPELLNLLSFMYQGEVNVPQDSLEDFFNVAEDLKVSGLDKKSLKNNLSQSIDSIASHQSDYDNVSLICPTNDQKIFKKMSKSSLVSQDNTYLYMDFKAHDKSNESKKDESLLVKKAVKTNGSLSTLSRSPHTCEKCESKFTSKYSLEIHTLSHHKPACYLCEQCNQKYLKRSNMSGHIEFSKCGTAYFCSKSDNKCVKKMTLKRHIESVQNELNNVCENCAHQGFQKLTFHEGSFQSSIETTV